VSSLLYETPAISRCAQLIRLFGKKLIKNEAALIVSPSPTGSIFLKSAITDLVESIVSSQIGSCQDFSFSSILDLMILLIKESLFPKIPVAKPSKIYSTCPVNVAISIIILGLNFLQ
jgi:hypothetical protein